MKYNNEYTNLIDKIDTSDEFKKKLIEEIKKEELKKGMMIIKIKSKITAILAALGILTCSGIVYATIVPEEIKNTISNTLNNKINALFGIETEYSEEIQEDYIGVQEGTINEILEDYSENVIEENIENYTELVNPAIYGIGDSTEGAIYESNYKQYDWDIEYDEFGNSLEKALEKYEEIIKVKIGKINYSCMQKFDDENVVLDDEGNFVEIKETTIEEFLEYQNNELKNNWNDYYHNQEEFNEELYFEITGMLVMNGKNLTEEDYYNNARAKKVKITFNNTDEKIVELEDTMEAQYIDLDYIQYDISKPVNISIEVLETYEGIENQDIFIADVQFGISSNIPQGI